MLSVVYNDMIFYGRPGVFLRRVAEMLLNDCATSSPTQTNRDSYVVARLPACSPDESTG